MSEKNSNTMRKKGKSGSPITKADVDVQSAIKEARERFARGEVKVDRWWYRGKKYGKD